MTRLSTSVLVLFIPAFVDGAEPPAKSLDLSLWMLTLPVGTVRSGSPDEIKQPELDSFADHRYFLVNEEGTGVVFRAHCGGSTTKGSKFPRCELREMTDGGRVRAAWDIDGQTFHTMRMQAAITKTPPVKPHVVCAQIHDPNDDVMMVRLEGRKLFIERNSVGDVMLDRDYKLGTPFEVTIRAGDGRIAVWYEGDLKMNWKAPGKDCYFKAGCYTQSNPGKGDAAESFGEVVIYRLLVDHKTRP